MMRRRRGSGPGAAPRATPVPAGSITLTPRKLVAGGAALATAADGRVVFVAGALPGETVRARVIASSRDFLRARVEAVESAAGDRVAPPCPEVARGCGGCDWMHVAPEAQLAFKAAIVADALARTAGITHVPVTPGPRVAPTAYRTTLRLALDRTGRPAFRGAGSHRLVTVSACQVAHPRLSELLPTLRIAGAREVQLRVSAATGARSARWWPEEAQSSGLFEDVAIGPDSALTEMVNGVALRVSADAFFQSGPDAAAALALAVGRAAGPASSWADGPVIDAYGGVGLLAATVVPPQRAVIVVEENAAAAADAVCNLAGRPAEVAAMPVESWRPRPAGLVIADPARAGLGPGAAAALAACRAPTLVLVSCDPVALARDARLLAGHGYRLTACEALDLFPQTHHVEVVSRFERV